MSQVGLFLKNWPSNADCPYNLSCLATFKIEGLFDLSPDVNCVDPIRGEVSPMAMALGNWN
jgi:hypothetical protein